MKTINDGGPAFPFDEKQADGGHYHSHEGMTLRDYFAAKAMAGYCAVESSWDNPPEEVARCAYRTADAMLKAREAR